MYGSLGAVVAFMFFTYVALLVFLLGAEMAALWPSVRAGDHDPGMGDDESGKPFGQQVRDFLKSLVSRNPTDEHPVAQPPPRRADRSGEDRNGTAQGASSRRE